MNVKPTPFFVVLAALVVAAAFGAAPASAQPQLPPCGTPHCGPFDDYPTNPCNGPNDPFCSGGGGGGGGAPGCDRCIYKDIGILFPIRTYACCTASTCSDYEANDWTITNNKYAAGTCEADNNRPSSNCSGDSCIEPAP